MKTLMTTVHQGIQHINNNSINNNIYKNFLLTPQNKLNKIENDSTKHLIPDQTSLSDILLYKKAPMHLPTIDDSKKQKRQTNDEGQAVFLKVGTLNVASSENWQKYIPAMMRERRFDFCCLQRIKMSHRLLTDIGAGNKLFWTGRSNEGVAIVVCGKYAHKVQDVVKVHDRIIHLKVRTDKHHLLNVFSVYAPESERFLDEKEDFYFQLKDLIVGIDDSELVVICGDFNGQVDCDRGHDRGVHLGRTVGEQTFEGALLWKFASEMKLSLANLCSKKKFESLVTNNVGGDGRVFDYILVPEKDKRWLKNCFTSKVENDCQHRMVVAILRIEVGTRDRDIRLKSGL
ncbi:hypothetical protein HELRODRAFT_182218 [Helobdella robusta]|uniref:Endonuclease/exonuclease/phosphatase domain-containing protein n=1 Tax=Helobdella robusta TaxID=6412 RepID=T1FHY2_HELRO|nr:hypothetical protein HELRODRAFT_182218 [Helobdella robusta]ESN91143.1 hypothetical protein HELRODRAFT_182218 [Helobdella robusta]